MFILKMTVSLLFVTLSLFSNYGGFIVTSNWYNKCMQQFLFTLLYTCLLFVNPI